MRIFKRVFLIVLILIAGISAYVLNESGKLNPVDAANTEQVYFEVVEGDTSEAVINRLYEQGLVLDFYATYDLAIQQGLVLYPNTYSISKSMTPQEILTIIANPVSNLDANYLLILEGAQLEQVATDLAPLLDMTKDEIISYWDDQKNIEKYVDEHWFLTEELYNSDLIHPLEGYFYPATYEITDADDLESMTEKFLDEMGRQLEPYKDASFPEGLSLHEVLTLASIVEREMITEKDRYLGAGVFYNRIKAGDMLGSDITTLYVLGLSQVQMTPEQLDNDSPYNTRKVTGLPPGPVAMPSIISIDAAVNPKQTDYYYFYATPEGEILYTDDLAQHEANAANNPW